MNNIIFEVSPVAGTINTNTLAVKEQLTEMVRDYNSVVFTEDKKADAKKDVAYLRKLCKDIEDRRKEVKKQWLLPYEAFETEVKELLVIVDNPIDFINGQVEAFEQSRIEAREIEIKAIYEEEAGDLAEFLPLYRIRNDKWINSSVTTKAIRKDAQETITQARAGKMAIESMVSDAVPEALRKFQSNLNLAEALSHINAYEANKRAILERDAERKAQEAEAQRIQEIERIRAEERKRIADEERIRSAAEAKAIQAIATVDKERAAPLTMPESRTAVYTVVGTDAELVELEMAMVSLGLYYERKFV